MLMTLCLIFIALMLIIVNLEALGKLFRLIMFAVFSPFILLGRIFSNHKY